MHVIVPTINDSPADFDALFALWRQVNGDGLDVTFDFSPCNFLRPHAVAFLGGLARMIECRAGRAAFAWNTLRNAIQANLAQQGFCSAFGRVGGPWVGNSIPYRQDRVADNAGLLNYLKADWLGRGWVNISDALRDAIVGRVWEIYTNAFEHGASPIGLFSCGQHYPRPRELALTAVDFGVGIPSNVRRFCGQGLLPAGKAMEWAFQPFTTTKPNGMGRGMGLDLLRSFIRANKGRLEVFSHDGHAIIDSQGEVYRSRPTWFEGTLVNLSLVCDDSYYCLASEVADQTPLF
ncbi:MAG: ATP-binding protein [Planctomycetia bacterium]|nr:ATP-binding protein [Planctomycetia bacterium]